MANNPYDISKSFSRIENELIDSMMRNMKRHQVEEVTEGKEWEQWQAIQLEELERFKAKNADLFQGDFTEINEKIDDMYWATYRDAQSAEEHRLMDRIKKGDFTPDADRGGFFRLNEGKIKALMTATKADFTRAEYALLRQANDQYRQIIFDSMTYANVTNDYAKAVDMATHDFLKRGITCIQYKNGARHTMSDYASMALRTGNKRAYLMGEGDAHDRYGLHTVRVNKRPDACPKCVGFLGKLLIDDVYGGGTRKEAIAQGIPTLSDAMQAGFLHPNCKDMYSVYIDGVSQPAKGWNKEEIAQITGEYNQEQELQHAEDMQASYQRMAKYSLDPENQQRYQARADGWQARADEIRSTPPTPAPISEDKVAVLRDMIAEAEAQADNADAVVRQWKSDKDGYDNNKAWAQLTGTDIGEYLEKELQGAIDDYNKDPHAINKRAVDRLKRQIDKKDILDDDKKYNKHIKQLRADARAKHQEVDRLKSELTAELDRIDKAKLGESTFDISNVEWSKWGGNVHKRLELYGVEYREVRPLAKQLSEEEIIARLAGGDMTEGSCYSLAQAYIANKQGLDVIDFRGGASRSIIAESFNQLERLTGLEPFQEAGGGIRPAKALLKKVEPGKEYMLITGRHASIVRSVDGELQWLELQSANDSGWHFFEEDYQLWKGTPFEETQHRNTSDTLKDRFGCKGKTISNSYLIDIDQYKDSEEFRGIMGYVNTAEHRQVKGGAGYAK